LGAEGKGEPVASLSGEENVTEERKKGEGRVGRRGENEVLKGI